MGGAQTKCHLRSHPHLEEENYRFEGTKISQQVHFPIVIFDQSTITKARGHNVKTSICIDGHSSTGYYFKLWTFGWSFDEIGRHQNVSPDWYPLFPLITKPPIYVVLRIDFEEGGGRLNQPSKSPPSKAYPPLVPTPPKTAPPLTWEGRFVEAIF